MVPITANNSEKSLMGQWLHFWFRPVDSRIYALVRISYALVSLINIIDLWDLRYTMFSDSGILDAASAYNEKQAVHSFSVFYYFHSEEAVTGIFILTAISLAFLAAGLMSRVAMMLAYVWQLSYMNYNPLMLGRWDSILTIYGFILLLSLLSGMWSVDAWIRKKHPGMSPRNEAPRYGLVLMRFQAVIIYFSVALIRFPGSYWQEGEYFSYFVLSEYFRFDGMEWIGYPLLMKSMNYGVSLLELIISVLLFTRWKGFALLTGFIFHLTIACSTNIYLFQFAMMMIYFPFFRSIEELRESVRYPFGGNKRGI